MGHNEAPLLHLLSSLWIICLAVLLLLQLLHRTAALRVL